MTMVVVEHSAYYLHPEQVTNLSFALPFTDFSILQSFVYNHVLFFRRMFINDRRSAQKYLQN